MRTLPLMLVLAWLPVGCSNNPYGVDAGPELSSTSSGAGASGASGMASTSVAASSASSASGGSGAVTSSNSSGTSGTATSGGSTGGGSTSAGGSTGGGGGDAGSATLGTCTPSQGFAGNSLGIGAYCTAGGGQCKPYSLSCVADLMSGSGNFCTKLPCFSDADCAEASCCTGNGGPLSACVPLGCDTTGNTCPAGD